jgi:cation/acetate symporter
MFLGLDPLFGISPEGFGFIGMILNLIVTVIVSKATAPPPQKMMDLIEEIRYPGAAPTARAH